MNQSRTEKSMGGAHDFPPERLGAYLALLVDGGVDALLLDAPVNRLVAAENPEIALESPRKPARPVPSLAPQQPATPAWTQKLSHEELTDRARSLAVGAANLAGLEAAVEAFADHPLRRTATSTCLLGGNREGRILVLADKPRSDEDASGEVLATAHQVLAERMLAAIGLCGSVPRPGLQQVMLANFVPWRPPGNRAVTAQEATLMLPFLQRMLTLAAPRAVLCLGALPGQFLAGGDEAINRARGKWLQVEAGGRSIPLLATFHPESLIASTQLKRLAWADLQSFRERISTLS